VKVHHLNCGTMRPLATPGGLVCHVLLVETENGLVLVDSGLGLRDAAAPSRRFGPSRRFFRPAFDPAEAALNQVRLLGFQAQDVRHIVLTHFDVDHAGGLADFPWARVHLASGEAAAVARPRALIERLRYRSAQRAHDPLITEHTPARGESWRGFAGAEELVDVCPDLVLISLPGHSRGHSAIAVNTGSRWVLHVGDAFYDHGQLDGAGGAPRALTAFERLVAVDRAKVRDNHRRLAELWQTPDPQLLLVNAHDPVLLDRARSG
jgi:glyoxylase-like metal-dependent hydrolase (beta-lactamase superfamily II)